MSVLILGAGGFMGQYLVNELHDSDEISVTVLPSEKPPLGADSSFFLDITDEKAVDELVRKLCPTRIYHLAAQSSGALSWKIPQKTAQINLVGTLNLLESVRKHCPYARLLLIGSGEEYGSVSEYCNPIPETLPPNPTNIYAVTKEAQSRCGLLYFRAYSLDIVVVRAFSHIGAGQSEQFVASSFCRQAALIQKGLQTPVIRVGNLDAVRDFTDVRDVARAYRLLSYKGVGGEIYNVGSGTVISIRKLLNKIIELSGIKTDIMTDPKLLRPLDTPLISADITKLRDHTGFVPEYSLSETLTDLLNYWKDRTGA